MFLYFCVASDTRLNKTRNWSSLLEMALNMVWAGKARGGKLRTKYLIVCFQVTLTTSEWSLLKELLALYWIPTVKMILFKMVALAISNDIVSPEYLPASWIWVYGWMLSTSTISKWGGDVCWSQPCKLDPKTPDLYPFWNQMLLSRWTAWYEMRNLLSKCLRKEVNKDYCIASRPALFP